MNHRLSARKSVSISAVLASLCTLWCSQAAAQSAGAWLLKGGINTITPVVSSGNLSASSLPNTQVDIKSATSLIATATYMVTNNISIEAYGGLPYEHDVVGAGALANVGKVATIKQVSPTLFTQYRFMRAESVLRPYIGLGLTYGYFYDAQGSAALTAITNPGGPPTTLKAKAAWGLSPQIGLNYKLNSKWFMDASAVKTFLETTNTLSTGQQVDVKLDPISVNVSLGYQF
jgi:outer membrane protein